MGTLRLKGCPGVVLLSAHFQRFRGKCDASQQTQHAESMLA